MRLRRSALVAAAALVFAVSGCGEDEESFVTAAEGPYTVELPEGWNEPNQDLKRRMAESVGARVESEAGQDLDIPDVTLTSFWSHGDPEELNPNAIVIREPLPAGVERDRFARVSLQSAERIFGSRLLEGPSEVQGLEVAGESAPAFDYEIELEQTLAKRTLFAFRGEWAYTLTLTSSPEEFDGAVSDLDEILASWTWAE